MLRMKKLLITLFSILISFNSFAGSIDGKGLKCVHEFSFETPPTLYVWFENNNYIIPYLEGYSIVWTQPSKYREDPNYITFNDENWNGDLYLFNWLSKRVYRSTLNMGNHYCKNCGICIDYYISNKLPLDRPSCRMSLNPISNNPNGYHSWNYYFFKKLLK